MGNRASSLTVKVRFFQIIYVWCCDCLFTVLSCGSLLKAQFIHRTSAAAERNTGFDRSTVQARLQFRRSARVELNYCVRTVVRVKFSLWRRLFSRRWSRKWRPTVNFGGKFLQNIAGRRKRKEMRQKILFLLCLRRMLILEVWCIASSSSYFFREN